MRTDALFPATHPFRFDLTLVAENPSPHGLPYFQANRGGIKFETKTEDMIAIACAWSDYRKEYGVSPGKEERAREHEAFKAGWAAARGTLDKIGRASCRERVCQYV